VTFDTQTMLAELDALTDRVQSMADELQAALEQEELLNTREAWTARELLNSGAAHIRGAAIQIDKYQQDVTPVTQTLLAEQEEYE